MSLLHWFRRSPILARLALVWYALTLGAAVASPIVHPHEEVVICTAAGMVKVTLNPDGSVDTQPASDLHCPLCLSALALPSTPLVFLPTANLPTFTGTAVPGDAPPSWRALPPPGRAPPQA